MCNFSISAASQVRFLLESLNDNNAESVIQELCQFVEYGVEGSIQLLQSCVDYLILLRNDATILRLEPVLASVFKHVMNKPKFSTVFCQSLKNVEISEDFLDYMANVLSLSSSETIGIGLVLSDTENLGARMCGRKFLIAQIEKLLANLLPVKSAEQIQNIVIFLQRSEDLSKHVDSFMQILSLVQSDDANQSVLTQMLSDKLCEPSLLWNIDTIHDSSEDDFDAIMMEMEKEMSMGDIMKELGYQSTVDAAQCTEILSHFLPLTEVTISKILGTIIRTHTGLVDSQNTFSTFRLALGCTSSYDLPAPNSWNVDALVKTIKQLAPGTNWMRVIENLDHDGFYVPNQEAFSFFMSVYRSACMDPFPFHGISGSVWRNSEGQLSLLKYAVSAPPELFTFGQSARQLVYVDAVHGLQLQIVDACHVWLCLDLLDVLCQLAERGHATSVRSVLDFPLKNCAEVLLLGMAHINTAYDLIQHEVCFRVFPLMVKNASASSGMLLHLWHVNPSLVIRGFVDVHHAESDNIIRILDICQELKILLSIIEMVPFALGIRLAVLAACKELVDLENWLSSHLNTYKDVFFEECLKFLKENHFGGSQVFPTRTFHQSGGIMNLYLEKTSTFLKVMKAHVSLITSTQLSEEMERLHATIVDSSPQQNGVTTDSSTSDGYGEDVETEANSYFHQMFSGQLTIDAMVQMLARFKESSVPREKSIFECMIANLFEEYRFFPKYPERQLRIAAILFGSVIKQQLVTHLTLGIALRYVLDALRKPADSKMFVFGTKALEQFIERLMEWPQYCNHILQISHLRNTHSDLVAFIERGLARISSGHLETEGVNSASTAHQGSQVVLGNGELSSPSMVQPVQQPTSSVQLRSRIESSVDERHKIFAGSSSDVKSLLSATGQPSNAPLGDAPTSQKSSASLAPQPSAPGYIRPSRGSSSTRFGSAMNIETLVAAAERRETPIEAPASEIQDKISFIINNISATNIETKSKEITEVLKEEHYPWFAQYMVMKRASIEPNFHDLYLNFLDKVNSKALKKEILQATYENCKVLLGSELIKSSSEERSLLKSLGSWLGRLTIGRNQVLRAREIDPKSLIIEAYEQGRMIAVIPFTSKILEPCLTSLAYQPPNPWTMGILGLLAEIYSMPNLKMNLKFDIEVLFKHLGVKDVKPTSLLKDRKREIEGNPDFSNKDIVVSQPPIPEPKPGIVPPLNHAELPQEVTNPPNTGGHTNLLSQYAVPHRLSSSTLMDDEKLLSDQLPPAQGLFQSTPSQSPFSVSQLSTPITNIGTHVIINQKLSALGLHLHFQRVVPIAMDRAIKEIVSSIVQRSVSIAGQTTKELVLKDYAVEQDESRIYTAAHLMVASLAGSLAHVTCKEPLRSSISSQLRNSLQGLNIASDLLDQAVLIVTNDNLDIGCAVIEQAATDKATQAIDAEIARHLPARRKNRESVGSPYFDTNMYAQGSIGAVPESLRPKPGQLSLSQQRVYEDFVRLPLQNQSSQISNAMSVGFPSASTDTGLPNTYNAPSTQLNPSYSSVPESTGFETVSRPLDVVSQPNESLTSTNLSTSSVHAGATDDIQQSESEAVGVSFTPAVVASELHSENSSDVMKETGVSSQILASSVTVVGSNITEPSLTTRDALDKFQIVAQKLEASVTQEAGETEIQGFVSEVPDIILRCISRDEAALAVAQRAFKGLYENASNTLHVNANLAILAAIRDVCKLVVKELTSWVIYSDEDRKFNKDITLALIGSELLNLAEYNVHMAKLIDGGRNKGATEFAISLLQSLASDESRVISELHNLVDALSKIAAKSGSPEPLQLLIEHIRNPVSNVSSLSGLGKEDKASRLSKDKKVPGQYIRDEYSSIEHTDPDPAGFSEQVSMLFKEWYQICEQPDAKETNYILELHHSGLLKGDDITERFIRILTEIAVAHCLSSEVSFLAIDSYAKLVFSILKFPTEQGSSKIFLLSKILTVTVRVIQKDAEDKKASFNPRPYFRLFINLLLDLGSLEAAADGANFQILTAFANAFHSLQPLKVPAFSFAWLELVSHRCFMPKLLTGNSQKGWPYVQRLLVNLLQFLEPFLRNAELGVTVQFLYRGTLRVLLVLLHDFPEFLCDYHFTFCDVIPPSCIQMRNIILSAFPRNMRLPDPSTPNLKIDLLPEISDPPRILSEVDAALKSKQMINDLDEYLKMRPKNSPLLTELKQRLLLSQSEAAAAGTRYNVPLMNSLVLYVGMQLQARTSHAQAPLDIFKTILELDTEGRYLFLNAIANQLRYPNNHTHYFSFILLFLFADTKQDIIQEQITRVLLERLIVNRPHPWGLLITFIELIKNPRYGFWKRSFISCAPEIEKLFQSVARSCGGLKSVDESMVSGWVSDNAH